MNYSNQQEEYCSTKQQKSTFKAFKSLHNHVPPNVSD